MRLERERDLGSEDGASMVELVVGMGMGMVVLAGLSMLLIVTMHGNARISARAEATDNARVAMTRIMEELHSACVTPTESPVQIGSNNTTLVFKRGTYGKAAGASQSAITTEIAYSNGTLFEKNTPPGGTPRVLLSNVAPAPNGKVFEYRNPTVSPNAFATPLTVETQPYVIDVQVAFKAVPKSEPVADAGAAAETKDSATLRLTPPVYSSTKKAMPCQ